MEMFLCDENKEKWYKKVEWKKTILIFGLCFVFSFSFLGFISKFDNMDSILYNAFLIAILVLIGNIISNVIENRINVYVKKDDTLYVIFPHSFGLGYDNGVVSYRDFKSMPKEIFEDIIANQEKYEGIDVIEIMEVDKLSFNNNRVKLKVKGRVKSWEEKGSLFTVNSVSLTNDMASKKIIIPSDYDNFEKLTNYLGKCKKD